MISVVILTYNSKRSLQRTLGPAKLISDDIHIVDSYSTDDTLAVAKENGCRIVQRAFENYGAQRNWAIENLPLAYDWQLHLDADEEMEKSLIYEIKQIDFLKTHFDGFILGRKIFFLGRELRYGGIAKTWHYRLFRSGHGRCEDRLYDQHFVSLGRVGVIKAFVVDHQQDTLSEWTLRHNRWSDLESWEVMKTHARELDQTQIAENIRGNAIERIRALKGVYYKMPLFIRCIGYFLFRYVILAGFLDGRRGLIYHVLQGFWFRFLVDAKIYEMEAKPDS